MAGNKLHLLIPFEGRISLVPSVFPDLYAAYRMLLIAGIISPKINYWKDLSLGSNNPELDLRCKSIREAAVRLEQQIPWDTF